MTTSQNTTNNTNLPWAAQVGTRRPRFFSTREEAEAFLDSTELAGWVAPSFMVAQ